MIELSRRAEAPAGAEEAGKDNIEDVGKVKPHQ